MKKILAVLLCLLTGFAAVSCGGSQEETAPEEEPSTSTLMIYMIGSDLESKGGAASGDLDEILASGVDLTYNNVVVCAGGSARWHNDRVSAEEISILSLGADGFSAESTWESVSMGEAETLANFLNYCAEKHPADHYSLILWDHGNGPLVGYGKDTLYRGDALTLTEMDQALESSPFTGDNKLEWIGFDACLMASAELCCVLDPYAKYLIASQEVEPAFGWNYAFLKDYGKVSTLALTDKITSAYLSECEAYFEKKGYQGRDATLACVDLSGADKLEEALNSLFAAAGSDVENNYDRLATTRAVTRALGRASTGSEYDLIDLNDLAERMKEDYPAEAEQLAGIVSSMVVNNATNTDGLCGMSLYYPFFNKKFYQKTWSETYREMGVFSDYVRYLSAYEKIWLGEDMKDDYAVSTEPEIDEGADYGSAYTLTLSEEQAQHFASAKYYILEKKAGEVYTKLYSSSDVAYTDGKLTANFDGNIIYAHNNLDDYVIPVTAEHDTVDGITNYSINVQLATRDIMDHNSEIHADIKRGRFVIGANKQTGQIAISSLMPQDNSSEQTADMTTGKYEDIDLTGYKIYYFWNEPDRVLTRDRRNIVIPVDEWSRKSSIQGSQMNIANGLEFVYEPLDYGSYALIFEIYDTQNNCYCSEPINIETQSITMRSPEKKEPTVVNSDGQYPLLLREDEHIALYLNTQQIDQSYTAEPEYVDLLTLYAENKSSGEIEVIGNSIICNDTVSCHNGYAPWFAVDAGKKASKYFDFGNAAEIGAVKELTSLRFDVTLIDSDEEKLLWINEPFVINFSPGHEFPMYVRYKSDYYPITEREPEALFGAVFPKQTVADDDKLTLEVLGVESDSYSTVRGAYRITNRSEDKALYIEFDGLTINDIFLDTRTPVVFTYPYRESPLIKIEPGMTAYRKFIISGSKVKETGITGAQKLDICYRTAGTLRGLSDGYGDVSWASVTPESVAEAPAALNTGERILMDENGVTVSVLQFKKSDYGYYAGVWYLLLENTREEGVTIKITDLTVNDMTYSSSSDIILPLFMYMARCGPGQKAVVTASVDKSIADCEAVFRFDVFDFTNAKRLFQQTDTVTLKPE